VVNDESGDDPVTSDPATLTVTQAPTPKSVVEKVTLKANGGKFSNGKTSKVVSITKGKKLGKMTAPKRKGYIFTGYYTKKTGGTLVKTTLVIKANKTFYAHWSRGGYVNVKCYYLHLRTKAGMTKIMTAYPRGTKVQILGKSKGWYHVQVGKKVGYMYSKYVSLLKK